MISIRELVTKMPDLHGKIAHFIRATVCEMYELNPKIDLSDVGI
jgi:hypothetical protein